MLTGVKSVSVVGLGLIGGSLAKVMKAGTDCEILGFDKERSVCNAAEACGAIDRCVSAKEAARADLLFLALCPGDVIQFVKSNLDAIRPGTIVAECCGVQGIVMDALAPLAKAHGFFLIGAHPMAGKEVGGFVHSDAALFQGASLILVPAPEADRAADLLSDLAPCLGFGKVVRADASLHDRMIAYTSQLPHALACAYVNSPSCLLHDGFSAGSYKDVSRVAKINEVMWTELFLSNREPLAEELTLLIDNLTQFRSALNTADGEALRRLMQTARERKEKVG